MSSCVTGCDGTCLLYPSWWFPSIVFEDSKWQAMKHPTSCSLPPGCHFHLGILAYPGILVNHKIDGSWDLWKFIPPKYCNHRFWSIPICFHPADLPTLEAEGCWGPQPQALWERFSSWSFVGFFAAFAELWSFIMSHPWPAVNSTAMYCPRLEFSVQHSCPFYSISDLQYPTIQTYPATQGHAEGLQPPQRILIRIHYTRTRPSLPGDFQPFRSVFAKQSPMGCLALGGQGAGKPIQTFVQASAPWYSCGNCGICQE